MSTPGFRIGLVGATGQVGKEFLKILDTGPRPDLPVAELRLFASERSAGRVVHAVGEDRVIQLASPDPKAFAGLDLVLTAIGDDLAKAFGPAIAQSGAVNVDKSNAWRMDHRVPLVVPEVNPDAAAGHYGIIAGPNCSTTQMVVALWPLHRVNPIRRIIVDTYQAVSGTGWRAVDELRAQNQAITAGNAPVAEVYPHQIAGNLIAEIGGLRDGGAYSEELKMIDETRKIMGVPGLAIQATCVRVPVMVGHSEAVHVEFAHEMSADEARDILSAAPGIVVVDNPKTHEYPTPLLAAGEDPVYVGRIRRDPSHPRGLSMWVVADNVRKGAALNAIQVFELIARNDWFRGNRDKGAPFGHGVAATAR
jgi:aspartate-semialdehyde dehydrogenase